VQAWGACTIGISVCNDRCSQRGEVRLSSLQPCRYRLASGADPAASMSAIDNPKLGSIAGRVRESAAASYCGYRVRQVITRHT
jgi:hypothetical protein